MIATRFALMYPSNEINFRESIGLEDWKLKCRIKPLIGGIK
jgi:hypothetical protein